MEIRFHNTAAGEWKADCALVFCPEKTPLEQCIPQLLEQQPWPTISPALRDFSGKKDEQTILYGHPDLSVSRFLLCGLGEKAELTMQSLRLVTAKAVQLCHKKNYATLGFPVEMAHFLAKKLETTTELILKEVVIAARLSLYSFDDYKSGKEKTKKRVQKLSLFFSEKSTPDLAHTAVREAEAEVEGMYFAKNLTNIPSNILTPTAIAEQAQKLAKKHGFACTVMDAEAIQKEGMNTLFAVGQGSTNAPCFIILESCPKGKEQEKPLIFVGKGITFDTGGISLKPALNMHEMKGDMGGCAAVLGFFASLGQMPNHEETPRIIGLIPVAENMPGGKAIKPGDVVTSLSGKSIEILNTDAEGRLVLCDALTYAQKHWQPKALIDIATLTGACVVALGDLGAGVFTKDKTLRGAVLDAAETTGELFWPLPLWEEYKPLLKSEVADIPNMGERNGGALFAALFLQHFIEEKTRWIHLDIAGPGYVVKKNPLHPLPGGTGCGVRIFCELMRKKI